MSLVKVLLVDDHDMVRMGLKTYLMLDPMFEVIGEAANGHEALAMLRELGQEALPDLVLMDLMMPVMNGAETTRAVLAEFPGSRSSSLPASWRTIWWSMRLKPGLSAMC